MNSNKKIRQNIFEVKNKVDKLIRNLVYKEEQ